LPPSRLLSARARRHAAELRQPRETLGLTGEDVVSKLGWSASKVSRIETSRTAMTLGDLGNQLDLYHVSRSTPDGLTEFGRTANQRGWWEAYGATLGFNYSTFIALAEDAEFERFYRQVFVPGLLDEGALRRQVGGPDVMAEQISYLNDAAGNPNITLEILPFTAGAQRCCPSKAKSMHFDILSLAIGSANSP